MNYLSHFYHELPCNDPYYACGLILPDLLSNFSARTGRQVKLHPAKLLPTGIPELGSLGNGLRQHYFVDGFFHDSDFFQENTHAISEMIREKGFHFAWKRLYAFSHVFLELMLDRKILLEDRRVCDALYALLDQVERGLLGEFISIHASQAPIKAVCDFYAQFCKLRFLYDYLDDTRLSAILSRLNIRLGNMPFSEEDADLLIHCIHDFQKTLSTQKFPKFPSD